MQLVDDTAIFSPTDLVGFLECGHLTHLELARLRGEIPRPNRHDPELDVLTRRGGAHERRHLDALRAAGLSVAEIDLDRAETAGTADAYRAAQEQTLAAMRNGVDVVYQATFFDGTWLGHADFLTRVDTPSELGAFSYEAEDTKLARSVKASAVLQLSAYSAQLATLQGVTPAEMHVVLGDGRRESLRVADHAAYFAAVKRRFEREVLDPRGDTYPEPVEHCSVCAWLERCQERRRDDDHLSLVAGIRRDQRRKLAAAGIGTTTELAASPDALSVPGIGDATAARVREQARLQVEAREADAVPFELVEPEAERGLCALPEPTTSDLFFDIEGDPFVDDDGLEYLFGIVELVDGGPRFAGFWAHSPAEEREAFEALVDLIVERWERDPDLHVFHYAPYEPSALKRLAGRHGTREGEIDGLLRGEVFVDLYRVVHQGVRIGTESYSLKDFEPLYMEPREGEIADAASSIVAYERWLEDRDDSILADIEAYNRDDCISTWRLRDWLEDRRAGAEAHYGPLPRPEPGEPEPSETLEEALTEAEELVARLTDGVPDGPDGRDDETDAAWLLAHLLGWHRREQKADWWAHFDRLARSDDELAEDPDCLGALDHVGYVGDVQRSVVHRYRFDPEQEHKLAEGDKPIDPVTEKPNTIVALDPVAGEIDLKRGNARADEHPTSLIPPSPIGNQQQRKAIARVAAWVADHGIDSPGPYRAVRDVLLRHRPRTDPPDIPLTEPGETGSETARRLVTALDDTCLPVQGPPGSGKTWTGARMVVDLVRRGHRVGITALSHRAINNLLEEVCDAAGEENLSIRALQKAEKHQRCSSPEVESTKDNATVATGLVGGDIDVAAGTAWLWSREELHETVDVLFVDEASQLSLADVVAVGQAARNLVLLGDPQQLAQPSQGSHPPGAERSALEHLLAGHATIPEHRGLFLEHTWRLHPKICAFVSEVAYDGRLECAQGCELQELAGDGDLSGAGLRFFPVEHHGNRTSSPEEAEQVAEIVERVVGATWTHRDGTEETVALDDVLVITPYNAQVACLARNLPEGARVGTVDKFQGQEAPVVVYSMAASSLEQIPRGMEFLFSLNRLNVATSRARCLAVLVCSPEFIAPRCRTPRQMRLANAMCRLIEAAREPEAP